MGKVKFEILLTGATGFLGSHLLPALLDSGHKVTIVKRSFSDTWRIESLLSQVASYNIDKIDIEQMFRTNKFDVIIHLATNYGRKKHNSITDILEPNIELPAVLLYWAAKYGVNTFINADTSTCGTYTLYSATKKAFTQIARFFAANYKVKFINMVSECFYGEKDDNNKFIPMVINNILSNKETNATQGEQKRDFIYVRDVVDAYISALDNLTNFDENYIEFDIGTSQSISLKNLVKMIEDIAGKKAKIKWGAVTYKENEIFDSKADIDSAKILLNWVPKTSLEHGLRNTIKWHREHK